MRLYQIGALIAAGIALLVVFQNCGRSGVYSSQTPAGVSQDKADMTQLLQGVNNRNLSCQSDADCEALAVGVKACGGPTSYIVASKLNPDLDQVKAIITAITTQAIQDNVAGNAVSTCEFLMEPSVSCVNNACAAGPATP
jgi:hypothetical protein